jgi:class 3 adenylate cyclase
LCLFYRQPVMLLIYCIHFVAISLIPVFNYMGKRIFASAWFSAVAIFFVSVYAIAFTADSYNFTFLPLIIFLQFFIFSAAEKRYVFAFTAIAMLCFAGVLLWPYLVVQPLLTVSKAIINAQRVNTLVGLPLLSAGFGLYAFSTINRAEREAATEKGKTERLLLNILPASIAERFKNNQSFLARDYESVTVLFADIVGFTTLSEKITPNELITFLNDIFSKFDHFTEVYELEKIKTIGDAYMVAGGVPALSDDHVHRICRMALDMRQAMLDIKSPGGEPVSIRIGINTGPLTAGVIGVKKFIYDLWGDTVNTASRMESHAGKGDIQITENVYNLVKNEFICKARGTIMVKGKGLMHTYLLVGVKE